MSAPVEELLTWQQRRATAAKRITNARLLRRLTKGLFTTGKATEQLAKVFY